MGRLMTWVREVFGVTPEPSEAQKVAQDTSELVKSVKDKREELNTELESYRGIDLAHTLLLARDRETDPARNP